MISFALPWLSRTARSPRTGAAPVAFLGVKPSLHVALDARRLVSCLNACTVAPGRQWRTLSTIVKECGLGPARARPALVEAVRRGWIELAPYGDICLTDSGRLPPLLEVDELQWPEAPERAAASG
jgi:hypothetical protein